MAGNLLLNKMENVFFLEEDVKIVKGYLACVDLLLQNRQGVSELDVQFLKEVSGDLSIDNCRNITSANLTALKEVGGFASFNGTLAYSSILDLSSLENVGIALNIGNNLLLPQVDLSSLIFAPGLNVNGNPALTNVILTSVFVGLEIHLNDNALSAMSVDAILVAIDNAGQSNGVLDLSGGTNAQPSVVGLTAVASLQGRGWTVSHN